MLYRRNSLLWYGVDSFTIVWGESLSCTEIYTARLRSPTFYRKIMQQYLILVSHLYTVQTFTFKNEDSPSLNYSIHLYISYTLNRENTTNISNIYLYLYLYIQSISLLINKSQMENMCIRNNFIQLTGWQTIWLPAGRLPSNPTIPQSFHE